MAPPSAIATETVSIVDTSATSRTQIQDQPKYMDMPQYPTAPEFDDPYKEREYLKGRLAAAYRIFAKNGFDEGVAGHITLRDPVDPTTFWVNPFGVPFSHIKASDLIRVDHNGNVVDGGPVKLLNSAAFMIHSAIHVARPDIICAAHSHSIYGKAFCTLGRELDCITQDSCAFYKDHVLYDEFNGVVLVDVEGKQIAKALGSNKAALLQNHGLLTVGKSIESTVFWFYTLDKCCQVQLLADAAASGRGGKTVKISNEEAESTGKMNGSERAGYFAARPLFNAIHEETKGAYLS